MKKNVASQKIGAQLITAADGTEFTGAVTVSVTIDAGAQATGSVGSGACAHEGHGYHTYAPAQAETNGDLIAFTFHGTGAVSVTVQVYTDFPQTSDHAASIASILADTAELQTDWVNGGRLDLILDIIAADTTTDIPALLATIDTVVDAILVDTGTTLDARIPAALVSGRMDASVGAAAANTITASALAADAVAEIADGVWDEAIAGHGAAGSTGEALGDAGGAGTPPTVGQIADEVQTRTIAGVTLVTTVTTLTNLPAITANWLTAAGIADNAITAAKIADGAIDAATFAAGAITAAAIATGAVDADALATDAVTEIVNAVLAGTVTELTSIPAASPTLIQAIALVYMALRNKIDITNSAKEIHNNAGTVLATKTLSDNGITYSETKMA